MTHTKKPFDHWNGTKKLVDSREDTPVAFPSEGEVWIALLGVNVGREQDGDPAAFARPVLVVKKFNNEMFWVVPLTSRQKPLDFYCNFTDMEGRGVAVVLAQLRLVSIKRFERKLYVMPRPIFVRACEMLRNFIPRGADNRNPAQGGASRSRRNGTV